MVSKKEGQPTRAKDRGNHQGRNTPPGQGSKRKARLRKKGAKAKKVGSPKGQGNFGKKRTRTRPCRKSGSRRTFSSPQKKKRERKSK